MESYAMQSTFRYCKRQDGIVLALTVIAMLALVGLAALVLDMGQLYVDKARLQNAVDAAALSAAKTLELAGNSAAATGAATAAANQAFTATMAAPGNTGLGGLTLTMQYSTTVNPFANGTAPPNFARASVTYTRPNRLAQALGIANTATGARAVAGPSPSLNTVCNILPIAACATGAAPTYGLVDGKAYIIQDQDVGQGNFRNVRLGCGTGQSCVRDGMAGKDNSCFTIGNNLTTEPGVGAGPNAQGLNQRFNCPGGYQTCGGFAGDTLPDKVADGVYPDTLAQYDAAYANGTFNYPTPSGLEGRRMVAVAMINQAACTLPASGGVNSVAIAGFGCFFLTQPIPNGKDDCGIVGQPKMNRPICAIFRANTSCAEVGIPGPAPGTGAGPSTIVLYNDTPGSVDA
jgi:Flp pilus assembly protein TadG